jgi:hypothetical protein
VGWPSPAGAYPTPLRARQGPWVADEMPCDNERMRRSSRAGPSVAPPRLKRSLRSPSVKVLVEKRARLMLSRELRGSCRPEF